MSGALTARNITKRFSNVVANNDISLDFASGEIHVLLGENGAGKSTLIGILSGFLIPDSGTISRNGKAISIRSPHDSLMLGIGTVFQHRILAPNLSVIDNMILGERGWRPLNRRKAIEKFETLCTALGRRLDPQAITGRLSLGEQQTIEILRALWRNQDILILDEPTSLLTPQSARDLLLTLRKLRDRGMAIILVTHKLHEALEFADRISILTQGRVSGAIDPDRLRSGNREEVTAFILERMFGSKEERSIFFAKQSSKIDREQKPILSLRNATTTAATGECAAHEISFDLWPGEILGIASIEGNGETPLAEAIAGLRKATGEIRIEDRSIASLSLRKRRSLGLRYVTGDRLGEGTIGAFSIALNVLLDRIGELPFWRLGIARDKEIDQHAQKKIADYDIRPPAANAKIDTLSGGNVQKVILAREMDKDARVIVLNKPTQGLDVQSAAFAHKIIQESALAGAGIVLFSPDLDELLKLSDRIMALSQGVLSKPYLNNCQTEREKATFEIKIGSAMIGAS